MPHFSVSSSILSATDLRIFLQKKYNHSKSSTCRLLKSWVNDTYLIENEGVRYIFRVYHINWRTKSEIQAELDFILFLNQKSIPVSYPISDAEEKLIQEFDAPEGKRYGVLFTFAEGEKIMSLSPDMHFKIGKTIAEIHQHSHHLSINRIEYTPLVLLDDSFKKIQSFLPHNSDELFFLENTKNEILKILSKVDLTQIRKGAVHLDIWADNINIDSNLPTGQAGNDFTIFDFDFCGNGWLVLDYAYHIVMLFITTPSNDTFLEKEKAFQEGYFSIQPLSEMEQNIIPYLATALLSFYLGIQCERFNTIFVNETYVKGFINSRIRRWKEFSINSNLQQ